MECKNKQELDEAIGVVNNFYRIYRERLSVLDEIKIYRDMGLSVSMVKLNGPKEE